MVRTTGTRMVNGWVNGGVFVFFWGGWGLGLPRFSIDKLIILHLLSPSITYIWVNGLAGHRGHRWLLEAPSR